MKAYSIINADGSVAAAKSSSEDIPDDVVSALQAALTEGQTFREEDPASMPRPGRQTFDFDTQTFADITMPPPSSSTAARQAKVDEAAALQRGIAIGFNSSALGSSYFYPSGGQYDQVNMNQAAIAGGKLWCKNSDGWAFISHTSAQGIQVLADFNTMKDAVRDAIAAQAAS
jgi:hypothetical protein